MVIITEGDRINIQCDVNNEKSYQVKNWGEAGRTLKPLYWWSSIQHVPRKMCLFLYHTTRTIFKYDNVFLIRVIKTLNLYHHSTLSICLNNIFNNILCWHSKEHRKDEFHSNSNEKHLTVSFSLPFSTWWPT